MNPTSKLPESSHFFKPVVYPESKGGLWVCIISPLGPCFIPEDTFRWIAEQAKLGNLDGIIRELNEKEKTS
jgi:hypothetical protein